MKLLAYRIVPRDVPLVPAAPNRAWMREHPMKLPHACHPLIVANEIGWFALSPCDVEAKWDGRWGTEGLRLKCDHRAVISNFGMGIVTWRIPYLFRTPPGWHLWVKGPGNFVIDGATPLEGVVETDRADEPFTMNWKITRRGKVKWSRGDPICQLVPIQTTQLLEWEPEIIDPVPAAIRSTYQAWAARRARDNQVVPYQPSLDYRRNATVKRVSVAPFRLRDHAI